MSPRSKPISHLSKLKSGFKSVWNESQTILLSKVQGASGVIILTLSQLNGYIEDPHIKQYLNQLELPKSISVGLVVLGLVTYLAHGHKDDA